MTNSPNSQMPGAFGFRRDSGSIPRLSGAKSHIFQPPRTATPSASSSVVLSRSTASLMSLNSSSAGGTGQRVSRKRGLEEFNDGVLTPRSGISAPQNTMEGGDWAAFSSGMPFEGNTPGSPWPLVNTRYQLAGGMDTPSFAAAHVQEERYDDAEYRRSLGGEVRADMRGIKRDLFGESEGPSCFPGELYGRESNGQGRYDTYEQSPRGYGWSKTAINVVGGVVGKVWEFCKNSGGAAFRGFGAGGGTKYSSDEPGAQFEAIEEMDNWGCEKNGSFEQQDRESTPLPGRFPEEDFIPDYMDNPPSMFAQQDNTPPRPAKRRQISANFETQNTEELAKNWVVVPETAPSPSPSILIPKTLPRPVSRFSMTRASSAGRTSVAMGTSRPASRAGFALSAGAARSPGLSNHTSRVSHAGSSGLTAGGGASYASPRSPVNASSRIPRATTSPVRHVRNGGGSTSSLGGTRGPDSPAAKEARKWAQKKKQEEREQDESIRRLDAQLKAMIREGKEALGTKVEVEMEDDEELYTNGRQRAAPGTRARWGF